MFVIEGASGGPEKKEKYDDYDQARNSSKPMDAKL